MYFASHQMPEEFNYDGDIMELKEEIKALQQRFIEVHKANEGVKAANRCVKRDQRPLEA